MKAEDIINWILTLLLIIGIFYAGHQRYFEDRKCDSWCKEKVGMAQIEKGGEIFNCTVNWDYIFAEENLLQNDLIKLPNLNNE